MCEFFFKPSNTGRMFTIKRKGKCKLKSFQLEKNIIKKRNVEIRCFKPGRLQPLHSYDYRDS